VSFAIRLAKREVQIAGVVPESLSDNSYGSCFD